MKKTPILLFTPFLILVFLYFTPQLVFNHKIDQAIKNTGENFNIGIMVKDEKSGAIIYEKNANQYFMPASNEKLFTAFAALKYLGENFNYQTQVFINPNKIKKSILNDDVFLKFSGDPTFTTEQLNHLVKSLSQQGIHQINGNIIVDDSAFDQTTMSPGSTWDDKDFCWSAPIHSIMLDNNCVHAIINPALPGTLANLLLPAYPQSPQFINDVTTNFTETNCSLIVNRNRSDAYTISGCINAFDSDKKIAMSIEDPRANLQAVFQFLLKQNNIIGSPTFKFEKIEMFPPLLASESSASLSTLIQTMLKESDNTIANSLFKTVGAVFTNQPGSFENGSQAVREILKNSAQLELPSSTIFDGSGASRYNFVTPNQIVYLLQQIYRSPYSKNFITSLPISGVDGTLKNRMKDSIAFQKVYAKTGTETAVSTLSGYLFPSHSHPLVFSIMINGFVDSAKKYTELEDAICAALIEKYSKT